MTDPVRDLAEALGRISALKLWSVLVTCLGDLSHAAPTEVSGLTLSALVERIGLQPQAMRVALHRLKRDGWIDSRREGRVGFHRLSQAALIQTRAVAPRIYGPGESAGDWHIAACPPEAVDALDQLPETVSAVALSRGIAVIAGPAGDLPDDWLLAAPVPGPLPHWARAALEEAACEAGFAALHRALAAVGPAPSDPLDRFALRVLALHGWRRLILRSTPAAELALGPGRAEAACRTRVHALLAALGPARLPDIQGAS